MFNTKALNSMFNRKFPDYTVMVIPPCISPNRESEYITRAKEHAIGRIHCKNVTIDHENKAVIFNR